MEQGSTSQSTSACHGSSTLQAKHKVFLSHSGAQKGFVEQLCKDLERCDRPPFFDKRRDSLPIGKDFSPLIFEAIEQCDVGVVVLSEDFFTSIWPMLELVTMTKVQKRKPSLTIMPVLLGLTLSQCQDVNNHERWLSSWQTWAKSDGLNKSWLLLWQDWAKCEGPIDWNDWVDALHLVVQINVLEYNWKLGEVEFREEIVEAICRLVPPGTRLEDSYIQGRSRLCKVIHERIKQSKVSLLFGVHVIGLHGFGGIGKTTLCKAMCNDVFEECHGKVAHIELGSGSEEELLKDVLRRLTDMNLEHLGAMNIDEYRYRLMRDMMNVKVFLTIDNVSSATRTQALTLLRAKYGCGSVVLVTARSLAELTSLGILASECLEMPELEMEEARSLFLYHALCVPSTYSSNKDDHELVSSCVQRCYFKKGDGNGYHYHPLALQTLGEQLCCVGYFPTRWRLLLHEIDFLNPFGEPQHPVFSILRRSFDALNLEDQFLFMDVALFRPYTQSMHPFYFLMKWSIFDWIGMVHGIPVTSVIERLENLKRKSLVANLGDEFGKIGMHDLWREFARLETKVGEFEKRRWMFEWDGSNVLEEASVTNGGRLVNMRRMSFLDKKGSLKLEDVNFFCFPSVTVLSVQFSREFEYGSLQELDLRGLKHLKSLELDLTNWEYYPWGRSTLISLIGLGSLLKLGFLQWWGPPLGSPCIDEISRLTNLQVLDLCKCDQVPDLSNLILLQTARFYCTNSMATLVNFSSNHTNLQFLDLTDCKALASCSAVGELVALQELCFWACSKLREVPNLQKLKQLRKLDVGLCSLLQGLPGLGDLVSLVELRAYGCRSLAELPDMQNLRNLRILDLRKCKLIKSLSGLNELVCIQFLYVGGENLTQLPKLHKLTNLQSLKLDPNAPLQSFEGLNDLISLRTLHVGIDESNDGLDLRKLTMLTRLHVVGWQGQGVSSLAELVLLESAIVDNCKGVRVLPDLQRLLRLGELDFRRCEFEDMSGLSHLTSLRKLSIENCDKLVVLPDLRELARLEELMLEKCVRLRDVGGIIGLRNLKRLRLSGDPWLHENLGPDPPRLMTLHVGIDELNDGLDLRKLTTLTRLHIVGWQGQGVSSLAELVLLESATIHNCKGVRVLPDLQRLSRLGELDFQRCEFEDMSGLSHLTSLRKLSIENCDKLVVLPDLRELARLKELLLKRCVRLRDVRGIIGLRNLKRLRSSGDLWLHENLGPDPPRPMTLPSLLVSSGGFADQQGPASCSQLSNLDCTGCLIQEFPDLANFPELLGLDLRDCVNLTKLTCTGPLSPQFSYLNVRGCMRLQALPDLTNSQEMEVLDVANSGVVLSALLIQDMKARWPSMDLITEDDEDDFASIIEDYKVDDPELREPEET